MVTKSASLPQIGTLRVHERVFIVVNTPCVPNCESKNLLRTVYGALSPIGGICQQVNHTELRPEFDVNKVGVSRDDPPVMTSLRATAASPA